MIQYDYDTDEWRMNMSYKVTKAGVAKAIREARHRINTGKPVDRLYAYAYPRSERVIYKAYEQTEEAVAEYFVCDLSPVLKRYCNEQGYNFEKAVAEAHEQVKKTMEVQGLC